MKIKLNFNKGFTLIELMITLLLSLLITYGIAQVLTTSNRTSVTSDGMSQSQETGRFVMTYLAKYIRTAGLNSLNTDSHTTKAFISCTDFPDLINDGACISEDGSGKNQTTIRSNGVQGDLLAVASIIPPNGNASDCSGSTGYWPLDKKPESDPMIKYAEDDLIINTFWVEFDSTAKVSNLMCKGFLFNGTDVIGRSTKQAIANGVEAMHLLYGEALTERSAKNERNAGHYVRAPTNPKNPKKDIEVNDWSKVYSVKISILTRSLTEVTNKDTLRRYILADATPYDMTDAVSRQVFTTTFAINNFW